MKVDPQNPNARSLQTQYTNDPVRRLFGNGTVHPAKGSILDQRKWHRWLQAIGMAVDAELYAYQETAESAPFPRTHVNGKEFIQFSSYDYLGLIGHPAINAAAIDAIQEFGTGTGGVRMLSGTNVLHRKLESAIADFFGVESALTFTSGYLANLALMTALVGGDGKVIADERIHRSLKDGLRLAKVNVDYFGHNDVVSLARMLEKNSGVERKFILTEGLFSMDGDICPLPEILELKAAHGAFLVVDEAHSLGVLGPNGRGVCDHFGISPSKVDVFTGSLSKAIPANGGFIAASEEIIVCLQHEAAPFIFSGALCPPAAAAASSALAVIRQEKWRIEHLYQNSMVLSGLIADRGYETNCNGAPIVPLILPADDDVYRMVKWLKEHGILSSPVVFPAVPSGRSRIRLCASVHHNAQMFASLACALDSFPELPSKPTI